MDYSHQNYPLFNGNNSNNVGQNYMMPNMAYNDNNQNQNHHNHNHNQQHQHQHHHSNGFLQQDFQNQQNSHNQHHHHHQQQQQQPQSLNYTSPPSSVGALSMNQRNYNQQQQAHHSPHSDPSSPPSHPVQFDGSDRSRLHHSVPLGLSASANATMTMPPSVPMMSSHSQNSINYHNQNQNQHQHLQSQQIHQQQQHRQQNQPQNDELSHSQESLMYNQMLEQIQQQGQQQGQPAQLHNLQQRVGALSTLNNNSNNDNGAQQQQQQQQQHLSSVSPPATSASIVSATTNPTAAATAMTTSGSTSTTNGTNNINNTSADPNSSLLSSVPSRTVYLGNVPYEITAHELLNHVRSGTVENLKIIPSKNCAFISFLDENSAMLFHSDAILKRLTINNHDIKVGWGRATPVQPVVASCVSRYNATRNVYLGNLHENVTEEELLKDLAEYGVIETIKLLDDKKIAFVHFISILAAIRCVQNLPLTEKYQDRKVFYGKDRCAFITKTQQHNAAQYLGLNPNSENMMNQVDKDLISSALVQQSNAAAVIATTAGGSSNLGNRTIYLGNLHPDSTIEEICNVVRGGILQNVRLISERHVCFITFIDPVSAAQFYAMSALHGLIIHNRKIKVGWGKHSGTLNNNISLAVGNGASRNIYIGGLDKIEDIHFTKDKLKNDFSLFGEIEQINFFEERHCCFVNFTNIANAIKAIDGIKNNSDYSRCKINFGKDRCGNMPRQFSLNNSNGGNNNSNNNSNGNGNSNGNVGSSSTSNDNIPLTSVDIISSLSNDLMATNLDGNEYIANNNGTNNMIQPNSSKFESFSNFESNPTFENPTGVIINGNDNSNSSNNNNNNNNGYLHPVVGMSN
ncbi:hypothetical protein B5S29_g519 [[Candida] boidinii]|nr:hypothetical protein B5S29_g519 [[Candida] boidinii]